MPTGWTEEIVWATTADGIEHEGIVFHPAEPRPGAPAVVIVHGAGSNLLYPPSNVLIARSLARRGHTVVSGNNRGHDMGTALRRPGGEDVLGGLWWEKFSESPIDIDAWIARATELGFDRVVLLGKSGGVGKATHYLAHRADPRVCALVLASGPFNLPRGRARLAAAAAEAERMMAEGRGQDLLPWGLLGPGFATTSAAALLDRLRTVTANLFGHEDPERAGIGRVTCPILAFWGTAEPQFGTAEDLEVLRRAARAARRVDTAMIEGADHTYRGHAEPIADLIHDWLLTLDAPVGEGRPTVAAPAAP